MVNWSQEQWSCLRSARGSLSMEDPCVVTCDHIYSISLLLISMAILWYSNSLAFTSTVLMAMSFSFVVGLCFGC